MPPSGKPLDVLVTLAPSDLEPPLPFAGATVAIDTKTGRQEAETDANGYAHFEHVEWDEVETLIADGDGATFLVLTRAAVDYVRTLHPEGRIELRMLPNEQSLDLVDVGGDLLNAVGGSYQIVSGHPALAWSVAYADEYALQVPRGRAFTLYALDFLPADFSDAGARSVRTAPIGGLRLEIDALDQDLDLAIDLGRAPPLANELTATIAMPAYPPLRENGVLLVEVRTQDEAGYGGFIGIEVSTDPSSDGEHFESVTAWMDEDQHTVVTRYAVCPGVVPLCGTPDVSIVTVDGPPEAGDVDPGFIAHVEMQLPHAPGPHPLSEPVAWELSAGETPGFVVVDLRDPDDRIIGRMMATGEEREMRLPALPSTTDPAVLINGRSVVAVPFTCTAARYGPCRKFAGAQRFVVAP